MLRLLLTADYEIFGNGTGDVMHCLVNPARKMMEIAEKFNGRVTFFVDVCELWAFERAESEGSSIGHQLPATRIKDQLQAAVARGHDVQLHAHPQWIGAKWVNGEWQLNMEYWRIGRLPLGNENSLEEASARFVLSKGKESLESLLCPIDPDYRCNAFRAGAWSIQPEAHVLEAIAEANIQFDTTAAPGCYVDNGVSYFDFRETPQGLPYWRVRSNMAREDKSGPIMEMPIFTRQRSVLETVANRITRRPRPTIPPNCSGRSAASALQNRSLRRKIGKVFARHERQQMFDFCVLSVVEMQQMVQVAQRKYRSYTNQELPVVTIGHPKNFASPQELEAFLAWMVHSPVIRLERLEEPSFWRQSISLMQGI